MALSSCPSCPRTSLACWPLVPINRTWLSFASSKAKTGLSLSIPKGPSNWTSWIKSVPTSDNFKDKSMVKGAFLGSLADWTWALACKAATKYCHWSWLTVIPAAWAWPPNWARCSLISVNQSKRWTASVERPLPLYWPLSTWYWKIRAGRW